MPEKKASFETKRMKEWLRPYLDPDYVPEEGPDRDKEFIREYAGKIAEALPPELSARPERPAKILVITRGTYGILHIPGAAGLLIMLRAAEQKYGAFELTELYDDDAVEPEMLSEFDAVVLNNVGRAGNDAVYNEMLPEYVRKGGGLFAVHGSALAFHKEPQAEYNRLLGAYVDSVNTKYGHPSKQGKPFPVRLPDPDHHLVQAFRGDGTPLTVTHRWLDGQERRKYHVAIRPPETLADELYVLIKVPGQESRPRVLVEVDREKAKQEYPQTAGDFAYALTWVKQHGQGRVYYTQLSHNMAVYAVPHVARAMLDGLQYAAGDLAAGESTGAGSGRITETEWVVFRDAKRSRELPALRIATEDGAEGYWVGDYPERQAPEEVRAMLARIHGEDASAPEELWDKMPELGVAGRIRKAVDIAVWDRLGRAAGKPVAELLGPNVRDRVALYVAGVPNMDLEQNVEAARQCIGRNIGGYKVYAYLKGHGPERDPSSPEAETWVQRDIALARAVGEAVDDSVALMFYPGNSYNLEQATRVGRVLDELGYAIYFDPMPQGEPDSLSNYQALQDSVSTPICAPIKGGGVEMRLEWMREDAVDINEIDVYAGFTPCLRVVRACREAGVPLDLHGGFPNDFYQFPLYPIVKGEILPWLGRHHRTPQHIPVATEFDGIEPGDPRWPWIKRIQARPVDAEGFVRLSYELPGMGVELDWGWIQRHSID